MDLIPRLRLICAASAIITACLVAGGCNEPSRARAAADPAARVAAATVDPVALLGRSLFFDPSLSASGKLSCAACHDPAHAYAPANALSVQRGGAEMKSAIFRAVPSLSYVLGRTPNWHQERASSFVERLEENDNPPFGGFGWDGRFKTLGEQAAFPLLSPEEMANPGASAVLEKLKGSDHAAQIRQAFGDEALRDPDAAMAAVGKALERFELADASFHPYSSKFDAVLDGRAAFTEAEARGERLFNDPARGNCASCHTSARGADGSHPLFTNFQFEVLGVPRNGTLGANKDARFYDLGLCGPLRKDQAATEAYCGMFKTPTLRNVATRGAFFHNGRFHTMREALEFYVERDTNPEKFYPREKGGAVEKFDDLPAKYRSNVDVVDLPLTKKPGEKPVWSDKDIDDVLAFLGTLTDGFGR